MANFGGYVLPGSIFIAFGLKWALDATTDIPGGNYTMDDGRSSSRGGRSSISKKRRRFACRLSKWPLEGITKLCVSIIGALICIPAAYSNGELKFVADILYATIYLFFALSGLVDILVFYCDTVMPWGLEKFTLALAFFIEGLMFKLHISHQAFMEQYIHALLVCAIFGCSLASLVEIVMPWSRIVRFVRAYFTLLHGSWYIQAGFILFSPSNSQSSLTWTNSDDFNSALIWILLTFAWHCGGALLILCILMALSRKREKVPPLVPPIEPFIENERSITSASIPRCHFSPSLSNYGDLKA